MEQGTSPVPAPGPHARRRLAWPAGIAAGLFVVAGLVHYAAGIGESSTKHRATPTATGTTSTRDQRSRYGELDLGIAYGTTPTQLLHEVGPPTKKESDCWLYRGRVGTIRGRNSGSYVDAMKFCFSAGPTGGKVVMQIFSHFAAHTIVDRDAAGHVISKQFYSARWLHPFTLLKVPDWYLQQSS